MATLHTDDRDELTGEHHAFAHQHQLPLDGAAQVRDAIARFDQVEGATDADRDAAWARILWAAKQHGVEVLEKGWRGLRKGNG